MAKLSSQSERVLTALVGALKRGLPAGTSLVRGGALPSSIAPHGCVVVHDGEPGDPEVLMSPLTYVYAHRAEIDIVVEIADATERAATFDKLKLAVGRVIAADRRLKGRCDHVLAQAPAPLDLALEGAKNIKAATIGVIVTYATSDPLE